MLFLGSFCRGKLKFCILILARVANTIKICCVQKIKNGRSYPVATERMLKGRVSIDYFLLQYLAHIFGMRGG